jgi:hypothetical protein
MRKILTDAAAVGNAAGRVLNWRPSESLGWTYYPNSSWANMLWQGGANFETPPPMITKEGFFKPLPATGARTLDSKTAFYYAYTLDSPGMIMRLPRVGSQYLMGFLDGDKNPFDGAKTYKVTLSRFSVRFFGCHLVSGQAGALDRLLHQSRGLGLFDKFADVGEPCGLFGTAMPSRLAP